MNLNGKLKSLLEATGLPIEQDEYTGVEDKYITFTYEDESPETYADNKVTNDTVYLLSLIHI